MISCGAGMGQGWKGGGGGSVPATRTFMAASTPDTAGPLLLWQAAPADAASC